MPVVRVRPSPVETAAPVAIAPKIYTTAATPSNFLFSHPFGILDSTSTSLTYPFFDDSFASASTSAVLASPPTHYLAERSPTPVLAMEGLTVSSPTLAGASIKRRKSTGCAFEVDANGERRPKKGDDDYVKRPENAFILFRRKCVEDHVQAQEAEAAAVLSATEDGRPRMKKARQADLSKMISQQWRSLSGDARTYWENLAKEKKRQHELLHPDYVYRPQRTKRAGGRPSKKGKAVAESEFEHLDAADSVSFVLPPPVTRTSSTSRKGRGRSYSMPSEYLGGQTVRVPAVPIPVVSPTIPEIPALHEQPTVLTRPRISEPPFDPAGVPRETTVESPTHFQNPWAMPRRSVTELLSPLLLPEEGANPPELSPTTTTTMSPQPFSSPFTPSLDQAAWGSDLLDASHMQAIDAVLPPSLYDSAWAHDFLSEQGQYELLSDGDFDLGAIAPASIDEQYEPKELEWDFSALALESAHGSMEHLIHGASGISFF